MGAYIQEEEEEAQIGALNKIHMLRRGLVGSGSNRLNQSAMQHSSIPEDPEDSPPKARESNMYRVHPLTSQVGGDVSVRYSYGPERQGGKQDS